MSLARPLAKTGSSQTGRRHEGRSMLREVYGWFTEGFYTTDLKDAAALLREMGA
jgi:hypothetical protein